MMQNKAAQFFTSTPRIMLAVWLALFPGTLTMGSIWGWGVLSIWLQLSVFCIATEAICVVARYGLRSGQVRRSLGDGSALVSAALICVCLPPHTQSHILLIAALGSVALAKHAYGGVGQNIFNPAMVGYAVVLVSFPEALSHWPGLWNGADGLSGATQLSEFRYRTGMTVAEFHLAHSEQLSAQRIVAGAFGLGGAVLLYLRLAAWRIPMAMLIGLGLASLVGYDGGSSNSLGSLWFHLYSGGFVVAALFVATDPVTHPRNPGGQWLFGLLIGVLTYLIRNFSAYPDGIAFAVLLANCVTPLLNRPRTAHSPVEATGSQHD